MKGNDMILSDLLSRQETDKSDPHEIIPISFDMKAILNDRYYNVENKKANIWFRHNPKPKIVK